MNKLIIKKSAWAGILVILVAAITLEATSLIQTLSSQKELREETTLRAMGQLDNTRLQINNVLDQAEAAVRNKLWIAQWSIRHPDSLKNVTQRILQDNPVVVGTTVAFMPGYFEDRPLLSPYSYRDKTTGEIKFRSLATEEYDYPSKEWFVKALNSESGYWSDPYVDEGGGEMLMTTFSMPVKDPKGEIAAVLTADISLEWMTDMFGNVEGYSSAFSVIASRTGKIMVCPVKSFVMSKSLQDIIATAAESSDVEDLAEEMLSGQTGNRTVTYHGAKECIYYAPVERTGWSMSIVIPEKEIFGDLRRMDRLLRLLHFIGLLMLVVIFRTVARNQLKFQAVAEKKEKMENDLRIASGIQMSMIPKALPTFPDKQVIDLAATIVPAREVGGDLYDFYIRDEKLVFCIGDVSGKGVPASLVMAVTRSLFRTVSAHEDSPSRIVSAMNDSMAEMNDNSMFVTFFCGILDMDTGHLRYCNAGHNAPLILTDKKASLDVVPNLPLGIVPKMDFQEQERFLHYDDALFLYTDGLTEAENKSHEMFGEKRMASVLSTRRSAQEQLEAMKKNVSDFVGDAPQSDDLTMLFIHYVNPERAKDSLNRVVLRNDISQISLLTDFMEGLSERENLDPGLASSINLALEEIVTNVIMYAYPEGTKGFCDVEVKVHEDSMEFVISDTGAPFDPTLAPEVDVTAGLEDRKIGGLGIHMVRHIMDSISYERLKGKNVLTLIKKL